MYVCLVIHMFFHWYTTKALRWTHKSHACVPIRCMCSSCDSGMVHWSNCCSCMTTWVWCGCVCIVSDNMQGRCVCRWVTHSVLDDLFVNRCGCYMQRCKACLPFSPFSKLLFSFLYFLLFAPYDCTVIDDGVVSYQCVCVCVYVCHYTFSPVYMCGLLWDVCVMCLWGVCIRVPEPLVCAVSSLLFPKESKLWLALCFRDTCTYHSAHVFTLTLFVNSHTHFVPFLPASSMYAQAHVNIIRSCILTGLVCNLHTNGISVCVLRRICTNMQCGYMWVAEDGAKWDVASEASASSCVRT